MTPLRLLLIEDSEADAELIVRALTLAGYAVAAERVSTPEALVAALKQRRWDLAIADASASQFVGSSPLSFLRDYDAELPFIFVSSGVAPELTADEPSSEAPCHIMKDRLVPVVARELSAAVGRAARKRAETRVAHLAYDTRLAHLAYHDALTDLPNRSLLQDRLRQALIGAERAHEPVALIVLDLDRFQAINDSVGHRAGDAVLQHVASRLRAPLRETDTVARLGGDEFAVILPGTNGEGAVLTAGKLLQELGRPLALDRGPMMVEGSIGIAWFPEHDSNADLLLQKAETAMQVAKSGNLGCAVYMPDRDRHAHRRLMLVTELREGIEPEQFSLDYQPIVNLQTGAVAGVEALARWEHPQQGRLLPGEFIDLAEHTGVIEPLTTLLLDQALAAWTAPHAQSTVAVAVNLSPRHLRNPDLPSRIAEHLKLRNASPSSLVLEITESFIKSDPRRATSCLSRLHEMGVRLAIDDFGTGDSSIRYLEQLPLDELKIDRPFMAGLAAGDDAIVRLTIDMAHGLGLRVVAEGVESKVVRDRLRDLGCDAAQGFFIAAPGPATAIRRWVERRNAQSLS